MDFSNAPADLIARALAAPLYPHELRRMLVETGYSDRQVWGYAISYATADAMRQRLDLVLGIGNWSSAVEPVHSDRRVIGMKCRLEATIAGKLVHREDVAPFDEQADDALKACATNAFKRAAQALCVLAYLRTQERVRIEVTRKGKGAHTGQHRNEDGTVRDFSWDIPSDHWHEELRAHERAWNRIKTDLEGLAQ